MLFSFHYQFTFFFCSTRGHQRHLSVSALHTSKLYRQVSIQRMDSQNDENKNNMGYILVATVVSRIIWRLQSQAHKQTTSDLLKPSEAHYITSCSRKLLSQKLLWNLCPVITSIDTRKKPRNNVTLMETSRLQNESVMTWLELRTISLALLYARSCSSSVSPCR